MSGPLGIVMLCHTALGRAAELARLQARHHKLREAVNDGLQQLDLLIETAQG